MRRWMLPLRNLAWHWRTHIGVLLGTMLGATIMTGALGVGDGVRYSLARGADLRLGRTTYALARGERFFRHALAENIADTLATDASGVLHLRGTAQRADESAYAGQLDVYGVDATFATLAPDAPSSALSATTSTVHSAVAFPALPPGTGAVNERLAARLRLRVGDTLVVRLPDPHRLPGDVMPGRAGRFRSHSVRVQAILAAEEFGDFRLRQEQREDATLFLPLADMQATLDLPGRCNLLLLAGHTHAGTPLSLAEADAALHAQIQPEDMELSLRLLPASGAFELRSRRVFLPPELVRLLRAGFPGATAISTYLAGGIAHDGRDTPYPFVAAVEGGAFPSPQPGRIILSDWLATDLALASPRGTVTLTLHRLAPHGHLVEETSRFVVDGIHPLRDLTAMHARDLMPAYPGLVDARSCREWDPDLPVDLSRIRPRDEAYWEAHGGTPRAFIHIEDAKTRWGTPYGYLTALRIPGFADQETPLREALREALAPALPHLRPVREEAEHARRGGVDFGHLFLGLSMFLLLAAFLLTGLLYAFLVEERTGETGTYLALGFSAERIRRMYLVEGSILAALGAGVGVMGGIAYAHGVLHLLQTLWQGAVGTTQLWPHVSIGSMLVGFLAAFLCGIFTIALCVRNACKETPHTAQSGASSIADAPTSFRRSGWIGLLLCLGAILLVYTYRDAGDAVGVFFLAGTGLLTGLLLLLHRALYALQRAEGYRGMMGLALCQATYRPARSLAAIAALACGVFVVVAVGANQRDPTHEAETVTSGTGGYALYGETALPLPRDGESPVFHDATASATARPPTTTVHPLRVVEGDDASCLNLHRVQRPALVGIDPRALQTRGAFTFVHAAEGRSVQEGWAMLDAPFPAGVVPAVADADVIQWGLGLSLGDEIAYENERGEPIRIRLVGAIRNSIFQGRILIPEGALLHHYPSTNSVRLFLVDADDPDGAASFLRERLHDAGVFLQPTAARLAMFGRVEQTYLSIFLLLGGLGILLGSVGLGVFLLRSTLARRGELALMRALGFSRGRLIGMLVYEHLLLLGAGTVVGAGASLTVLVPSWTGSAAEVPWATLLAILVALPANGLLWIVLAALVALASPLLPALRSE